MFLADNTLAYKPVFLNLERNVERETETFSVPPLYTCKLFVYSWLPISPHPLYPTYPLRVMPLPTGPAASWTPSVIFTLFEGRRVITATTLSILALPCSKILPENTGSATRAPDSKFGDPRSIPSSRQHLCCYVTGAVTGGLEPT